MEYDLTLVLGAGSSLAMGYPVGAGLRDSILEDALTTYRDLICNKSQGVFEDQLENFVETFRGSQLFSIDSFLAKRKEFSEIGKRSIAAILLHKENKELLSRCAHLDHWYQYFFNQIASAHEWSSLSFKKLAIVTFNYDRSLEHYLLYALMSSYGKPADEAQRKIAEMKIIHVYGSLGPTDIREKNYFPYGATITAKHVDIAATMLKVIPEGRDDDASLTQAREILANSKRIGFLGFGFDELNLKRLHSKETCNTYFQTNTGNMINRVIVATCFGMKDGEISKAANSTMYGNNLYRSSEYKNLFLNSTCTDMLRSTLILDSID